MTIIPVCNCIYNSLTYRLYGILRYVPSEEPVNQAAFANACHYIIDSIFNYLRNCSLKLFVIQKPFTTWRLFCFCRSIILQKGNNQLRLKCLWIVAKYKQASHGRAGEPLC